MLTRCKIDFVCVLKAGEKVTADNKASEDMSIPICNVFMKSSTFRIYTNKIVLIGASTVAKAILNIVFISNKK